MNLVLAAWNKADEIAALRCDACLLRGETLGNRDGGGAADWQRRGVERDCGSRVECNGRS